MSKFFTHTMLKIKQEIKPWLIQLLLVFLLSLFGAITFILISYFTNNFSYVYGYLLCLLIPFVFLFADWIIREFLLKTQTSKLKTMLLVIIIHIVKYGLFIVLPLCGFLVNKNNSKEEIFSIYGMIMPLFIVLIYIICYRIISWYITKKQSQQKNSINKQRVEIPEL